MCVCVFCLSRASEGGPPITNGSVNDGVLQRLPVAPRQAQLDDLGQASLNTKAMSRQHCRWHRRPEEKLHLLTIEANSGR